MAEYCPYCGPVSWALVVALAEFGKFSNLHFIRSSAQDIYPRTPMLSFYGSQYTSSYLTFSPYEVQNVHRKPLQNPPQPMMNVWKSGTAGQTSVPYVTLGGQAQLSGSQFSPGQLKGQGYSTIIDSIRTGQGIGVQVDTAAYFLVQSICQTLQVRAPACAPS